MSRNNTQDEVGEQSVVWQRLFYLGLVRSAARTRHGLLDRMWSKFWAVGTGRMTGTTTLPIHGVSATVNTGYAYPAFQRRWPTYNDPLVQIVHSAGRAAGRPVTVVDVGAAVGDTVLLIMDRCRSVADRFLCFEPDAEFYGYLAANLGGRDNVVLYDQMLADHDVDVPDLVRTHSGTASAQGEGTRAATTFDAAIAEEGTVDVLKVDTDGYDGLVLAGARDRLASDRPAVIFEWHPILAERTGQDWMRPFEVLQDAGYRWFVWFTKEGELSHLSDGVDRDAIRLTAEVCTSGHGPRPDWHYDVVALHADSTVPAGEVASLADARRSRGA